MEWTGGHHAAHEVEAKTTGKQRGEEERNGDLGDILGATASNDLSQSLCFLAQPFGGGLSVTCNIKSP